MQANSVTVKQLVIVGIVLVAFQCVGCGPSGTDAVKFANQRISELKAQKRKVVKGDQGKLYSEAIEIRNANPGFKQDGKTQSIVSYEYRMLRSAEFDPQVEASDAELSAVDEEWQSCEELFIFKDGDWELKEGKVIKVLKARSIEVIDG